MKCSNCGKDVQKTWKFCRHCGAPVDNNTSRGNKKRIQKKPSKWILIGTFALIAISVICGLLIKSHSIKKGQEDLTSILADSDDFEIPGVDAEIYFEERAEVVSVIDAAKSESVLTEKQVTSELKDRGFMAFPISSCYAMDGSFHSDTEISASSGEKHPLFTTYYVCSTGEYWTIYEVNGSIIAYPVSYNLQSLRGVQLVVSESEIITSYDSESNQFYETIPNQNALVVITVDRIDAESLEKLTADVLDSM